MESKLDPKTNPILNSPFEIPNKHWKLDDEFRATDKLVDFRRPSGAYLPVPRDLTDDSLSKGEGSQFIPPHTLINRIRVCVNNWREAKWAKCNKVTYELLEHLTGDEIEQRPFFCQIEALETVIWLKEAGNRFDYNEWKSINDEIEKINLEYNDSINRIALKLATGTGKTYLMAMIISWLAINSKSGVDVLVITPGLTVKDRLQEINPNIIKIDNVYRKILPTKYYNHISKIRLSIVNYHKFQQQNTLFIDGENDRLTGVGNRVLNHGKDFEKSKWEETEIEMLSRIFKSRRNKAVYVINDEAHHCYKPRLKKAKEKIDSFEKDYQEAAALWFNALRTINNHKNLIQVFDLSATPIFLSIPANLKSNLFPWTVSDYPLVEAIEAGLTKIPKVPVDDDSINEEPIYRDLYEKTHPKKIPLNDVQPNIKLLLEEIHRDYTENFEIKYSKINKTPVFLVVANTVENATALFGYLSGYKDNKEKKWVKGAFGVFSNIDDHGHVKENPPTLLVHSKIDQDSDELPKELERVRIQQLEIHTDPNLSKAVQVAKIRDIFNSVGKKGEPGEHIRCIVSVSMLTEGWDTRTVTHILGYRKFGTQLLCEQVAGRGLRRTNFYDLQKDELLMPEFVNIYGIPFMYVNAKDQEIDNIPPDPYIVRSLPERSPEFTIKFPNIVAYKFEEPQSSIKLNLDKVKKYKLDVKKVPTITEVLGTVGEEHFITVNNKRRKLIYYKLAASLANKLSSKESRRRKLFCESLNIISDWINYQQFTFDQLPLLLIPPHSEKVILEISKCCEIEEEKEIRVLPVFADYTDHNEYHEYDTSGVHYLTSIPRCHDTTLSEINKAPCDSNPEVTVAEYLDRIEGIHSWVRNHKLNWEIPYFDNINGGWRNYRPDFFVKLNEKSEDGQDIYLIIEYKGEPSEDSDMKTEGVEKWWIPAVQNSDDPSCNGIWKYVFIDTELEIESKILKSMQI